MKGILAFAAQFLQDDAGNNSLMRAMVFIIVLAIMGNWTFINIKTGTLTPLSWEELGAIVGSLAVKAFQKTRE